MEDWRVLDKTSLIPTQVSLVDMMDRSGEHVLSFFLKNLENLVISREIQTFFGKI